jgi:serine/threonine protein kinase
MVIGQYKIIEKIGEGGMGVIYKAEHSTLEQVVAIKALPSSLSSNTEIRERFIREATIQAKISHPYIVNILNFFEFEGNYYIVMEYVEGETLEAMIKRLGLIPPEQCLSIFEQIAAGIEYAHGKGIIHRDIKPGNVMVNSQGTVKIMDFGIAKIAGGLNLTRAGVKVGTVWYMSPEQVKGYPATVTTDIYALGVTLFEMVTGRVPFYADSEYNVMKNIVESLPTSPKVFYPYIPDSMENAILKALSKTSVDRFQSVKEFAAALSDNGYSPGVRQPSESPFKRFEQLSVLKKIAFSSKQLLWIGFGLLIICCLVVVVTIKTNKVTSIKPSGGSDGEVSSPTVAPGQLIVNGPVKLAITPKYDDKIIKPADKTEKDKPDNDKKRRNPEAKKVRTEISHYLNKGKQYHEDGKFPEARGMYKKVLQFDNNNEAALSGIDDANRAERALLR